MDTTVGHLRRLTVTLPQAAGVLDVDVRHVRKAVDRHLVAATVVTYGKQRTRRLDGIDVLYLRIGKVLEKKVCREYYLQLKQAPDRQMLSNALVPPHAVEKVDRPDVSSLVYDAAQKTVADIQSLGDVSDLIDENGDIRGLDVEAHRIAALACGGMSSDEIMDDYPALQPEQINAAVRYAETNPKPGRPFPTRTAKSVLRRGGGGGLAAAFAAARDTPDDA